jgi:hypothetical protein
MAVNDMRAAVRSALSNGVSREDLILAIDEECVREVLES